MSRTKTIKRDDFVRYFAQHANLTYVQSERAYAALMRMLEHGIASKASINLGRVGVLEPRTLGSRRVVMGFKRTGGRVVKCRREFFIGVRTRFVFRMHRAFGSNHGLVQ